MPYASFRYSCKLVLRPIKVACSNSSRADLLSVIFYYDESYGTRFREDSKVELGDIFLPSLDSQKWHLPLSPIPHTPTPTV